MEKGVEVICLEVVTGPFGGWGGRAEEKTGRGSPAKFVDGVEEFRKPVS